MSDKIVCVETSDELRGILGEVAPRVANKVKTDLGPLHKAWIDASPLYFISSVSASGHVDISPKGDPAGSVLVLDDKTVVLPERPGNRRADGFHNVLENPRAGLIFLIPGRGDTLRVSGSARLVRDAPFFDRLAVRGRRPALALMVSVESVFFHCSKAFLRSELWDAKTWRPDALPSRAQISKVVERPDESLEALEAFYGPEYRKKLYRDT
ncbi:MAG: PPOX class probable FMN-dependent enzyme [Polyangiales bacterium]|jgi:PPOX class probable FMN-dependent enzyme